MLFEKLQLYCMELTNIVNQFPMEIDALSNTNNLDFVYLVQPLYNV